VDLGSEIRSFLEAMKSNFKELTSLLEGLGYSPLPEREQPLETAILLQKKELRERVRSVRRVFSMKGQWTHPSTGQVFTREANIIAVELADESYLSLRWPFEITRYVALHGLPSAQGLFIYFAQGGKSVALTAYTQSLVQSDVVVVRRLLVDLENVTRTDVESIVGLKDLAYDPRTIIQKFADALPYRKVGENFFSEYHTLFQLLSKRLREAKVLTEEEEVYEYAQRFLGRIVFLYFLQRKGWLNRNKAYLKLCRQGLTGDQLFEWLYELFTKLNTEKRQASDLAAIPFLNGSLFETDMYSKEQMKRIRSASAPLLSNLMETLDAYNFTISESTSLDKEVAVDPELLGNIFESMLPETERGDKGTFYTHQDEMRFMAHEGIRSYLRRFPELVSENQVHQLVYGLESADGLKLEPRKAREVKEKLGAIKLLDPAVGSGGFLLAALQVLLEVRRRLNGVIGTIEQDYDMKLEFIQKCLFGVDIESEAVELARLRLWLTLVVDESVENVRRLPNLDYNLYRGDSLKVAETERGVQTRLTTDHIRRRAITSLIKDLRLKFVESYGKAKARVAEDMDSALRELIKLDTGRNPPDTLAFSYRYFFPDIMEDGGFDVILMNPPYIRQEDIGRLPGQDTRRYKEEIIADASAITKDKFLPDKRSDISTYFLVRTFSLLKNGGAAVVIATSKWLDVGYGAPLQEYLVRNVALECVFESEDRSFSALVNVAITVMKKTDRDPSANLVRFVYFKIPFKEVGPSSVSRILETSDWTENDVYRIRTRKQQNLLSDGYFDGSKTSIEDGNGVVPLSESVHSGKPTVPDKSTYIGSKWGNVWLRAPSVYFDLLSRIKSSGRVKLRPLSPLYGIKAGQYATPYDFFIIQRIKKGEGTEKGTYLCRNGLGHQFYLEKEYCPPILREAEDASTPLVKLEDISWCMFCCDLPRSKLAGTRALKYIQWAETSPDALVEVIKGKDKGSKVRVSEVASAVGKEEWWRPRGIEPTDVFLPIIVKNRPVIPRCDSPMLSSRNFCPVYAGERSADLWLYMNSMIFRMFMELYGRIEAPAVQLMVEEYKLCPVPYPLPTLSHKFKRLHHFEEREILRIVNIVEEGQLELEQQDRRDLDDLVLKEIGIVDDSTRRETMQAIYDWLQYHVRWRVEKPIHAPKSPSRLAARRAEKGVQTKI